jgi:hypothetical protein
MHTEGVETSSEEVVFLFAQETVCQAEQDAREIPAVGCAPIVRGSITDVCNFVQNDQWFSCPNRQIDCLVFSEGGGRLFLASEYRNVVYRESLLKPLVTDYRSHPLSGLSQVCIALSWQVFSNHPLGCIDPFCSPVNLHRLSTRARWLGLL